MKTQNLKKITSFLALSFVALVGTYNAVVINSQSEISSDIKFVKRLDEMNGIVIPGRVVAATTQWQKLEAPKIQKVAKKVIQKQETSSEAPAVELIPAAAVSEELSLTLVEVINPKKWQNGLKSEDFYGVLATNDGIIEDLNVSLPNGEGLAVSFSEMTGNVFEYDFDGSLYSGMMYQVDQNSYMVTLSNGPLEGTRLRFSGTKSQEEIDESAQFLADNNIEAGDFGEEFNHNIDQEHMASGHDIDQSLQENSFQF